MNARRKNVHRQPFLPLVYIAALACFPSAVGCGPNATREPSAPTSQATVKILFIGDSITFANGGLALHMERLAASRNPPLTVQADMVAAGGAPLESLWKRTEARETIRHGAYDVVVLQEDIPETDVETFHKFARRFVRVIEESGARPVLFMAWSYERLAWITQVEIAQAHDEIAAELRVDVAPVGLAWQDAMEERPDVDLFSPDREHPSMLGTYLAVNVVYATVFEESPIGLPYLPSESMSEADAAFLQRLAWDTWA